MSAIYWHSPSEKDVRIAGSERHYAAYFADRLIEGFIPDKNDGWPRKLFKTKPEWEQIGGYKQAVMFQCLGSFISDPAPITFGDMSEHPFNLVLNTAMAIGGDAVKLLARLHGQCEIHCWVDGPNRAWLADVIRAGRKLEILRRDMGWEDVVDLLCRRDDEPVVTSFSVTQSFPDPWWILSEEREDDEEIDEEAADAMYDDSDDMWKRGMTILREAEDGFVEMRPGNWATYGFGNGHSLFDFREAVIAAEKKEPALK